MTESTALSRCIGEQGIKLRLCKRGVPPPKRQRLLESQPRSGPSSVASTSCACFSNIANPTSAQPGYSGQHYLNAPDGPYQDPYTHQQQYAGSWLVPYRPQAQADGHNPSYHRQFTEGATWYYQNSSYTYPQCGQVPPQQQLVQGHWQ